jgi:hypothetical protein
MPSKMVTDRQTLGRQVSAAIGVHAGEVAASLDRQVRGILGEGVTAIEELQVTLQRAFDAHLAALVDADETHLDALAVLQPPRRRRDAVRDELFSALTDVRRLALALYGPAGEVLLDVRGPLSRNPEVLLRQASRAVTRLSDPEVPRPEALFATAAVSEEEWIERLEPPIAALEEAIAEVASARRQSESTLEAKNEALAAYDLTFGRTARFMEALFDLSGLPSFASRLRPPVNRRGGGGGVVIEFPTAGPVEPEETEGSGQPAGSGDGESPEEAPPIAGVG